MGFAPQGAEVNSWETLAAGKLRSERAPVARGTDQQDLWAAMSNDARVCARCGLNDGVSPGLCAFHPALVPDPGPLLFGPEWQACSAGAHTAGQAPCFARAVHTYTDELLEVAAECSSPAPQPRMQRPAPSRSSAFGS